MKYGEKKICKIMQLAGFKAEIFESDQYFRLSYSKEY